MQCSQCVAHYGSSHSLDDHGNHSVLVQAGALVVPVPVAKTELPS